MDYERLLVSFQQLCESYAVASGYGHNYTRSISGVIEAEVLTKRSL